jgi:transposase-like protein
MDFVSYKDRKAIATALKDIYRAIDAQAAEAALGEFEAGPWGKIPRHRPKLASRLGASHSILCVSC